MRHREDRWFPLAFVSPRIVSALLDGAAPADRNARARAALFLGRAGAAGWNSIKRHDASKPAPALRRAIRIRDQECGN